MRENKNKSDDRVEKVLVMVNSMPDPKKKQHSIITFEDERGDRYEYSFSASLTEKSRNKFFRQVRLYEYLPLLQNKNNKPQVRVAFKHGGSRLNPITGRYIHKMIQPVFKPAKDGTG